VNSNFVIKDQLL